MPCVKKPYPSSDQALKRARNIELAEHKALYSYKCRDCGKWHLTSKRPAKRSYKRKADGRRMR